MQHRLRILFVTCCAEVGTSQGPVHHVRHDHGGDDHETSVGNLKVIVASPCFPSTLSLLESARNIGLFPITFDFFLTQCRHTCATWPTVLPWYASYFPGNECKTDNT